MLRPRVSDAPRTPTAGDAHRYRRASGGAGESRKLCVNTDRIDIVSPSKSSRPVSRFREIMSTPLGNVSKNFCDFKMEREDAPVFRYIYPTSSRRGISNSGLGKARGHSLCLGVRCGNLDDQRAGRAKKIKLVRAPLVRGLPAGRASSRGGCANRPERRRTDLSDRCGCVRWVDHRDAGYAALAVRAVTSTPASGTRASLHPGSSTRSSSTEVTRRMSSKPTHRRSTSSASLGRDLHVDDYVPDPVVACAIRRRVAALCRAIVDDYEICEVTFRFLFSIPARHITLLALKQ